MDPLSFRTVQHQTPGESGRGRSGRGEASSARPRDEIALATQGKKIPGPESLLTRALGRGNMLEAWKRVQANKGAPGADGLTIEATWAMLKTHWPTVRERILKGTYRPSPTLQVSIPKPNGGQRKLGIPTVLDRLIQQALLQVLQPMLDPWFSETSFGFRPGRSAHGAVQKAFGYVQAGYRTVVDVDLENFFDCVDHDILMGRMERRCSDVGVLRLIRAYLTSETMVNGQVEAREVGTPQGGPLSPLLANVLLDEVDKTLETRGHRFVRYADDCNVYVRSQKAGERVLVSLRRVYSKLKLVINQKKTYVGPVFGRRLLGYCFRRWTGDAVRIGISAQAVERFKDRVRSVTGRAQGKSLRQVAQKLQEFMPGWKNYFYLAKTPRVYGKLDQWIRHRLRAVQLKHWSKKSAMIRGLLGFGATRQQAETMAGGFGRWWRCSSFSTNKVLDVRHFDRLGVPRLL